MPTDTIHLDIDRETLDKLQVEANREGVTVLTIMRAILEEEANRISKDNSPAR